MSQTAFCVIVVIVYLCVGFPFIVDAIAETIDDIKTRKENKK